LGSTDISQVYAHLRMNMQTFVVLTFPVAKSAFNPGALPLTLRASPLPIA